MTLFWLAKLHFSGFEVCLAAFPIANAKLEHWKIELNISFTSILWTRLFQKLHQQNDLPRIKTLRGKYKYITGFLVFRCVELNDYNQSYIGRFAQWNCIASFCTICLCLVVHWLCIYMMCVCVNWHAAQSALYRHTNYVGNNLNKQFVDWIHSARMCGKKVFRL